MSKKTKKKQLNKTTQTSLNGENLLSHHRQHLQVNAIKFVKAGPSTAGQKALITYSIHTHKHIFADTNTHKHTLRELESEKACVSKFCLCMSYFSMASGRIFQQGISTFTTNKYGILFFQSLSVGFCSFKIHTELSSATDQLQQYLTDCQCSEVPLLKGQTSMFHTSCTRTLQQECIWR